MFRSRIELADTLSEVEKDHKKHAIETRRAEERTKELEVALRAADEVFRQITRGNIVRLILLFWRLAVRRSNRFI